MHAIQLRGQRLPADEYELFGGVRPGLRLRAMWRVADRDPYSHSNHNADPRLHHECRLPGERCVHAIQLREWRLPADEHQLRRWVRSGLRLPAVWRAADLDPHSHSNANSHPRLHHECRLPAERSVHAIQLRGWNLPPDGYSLSRRVQSEYRLSADGNSHQHTNCNQHANPTSGNRNTDKHRHGNQHAYDHPDADADADAIAETADDHGRQLRRIFNGNRNDQPELRSKPDHHIQLRCG